MLLLLSLRFLLFVVVFYVVFLFSVVIVVEVFVVVFDVCKYILNKDIVHPFDT